MIINCCAYNNKIIIIVGTVGRVAVISSFGDDIGSAALNLLNESNNNTIQVNLTKDCSGVFVSDNFDIPMGSSSFHLVGTDTDGVQFTYNMKQKAKFKLPNFQSNDVFSFAADPNDHSSAVEMNRDELLKTFYNFTNNWVYDAYFNFTASIPSGFVHTVKPKYSLVAVGDSVRIELLLRVIDLNITHGSSHRVTLSASSCRTKAVSFSRTVVIVSYYGNN